MIQKNLPLSSIKIFFATLTSLSCSSIIQATPQDPHSFCFDKCKPAICNEKAEVKAECQKVCGPIIDTVAAKQLEEMNKKTGGSGSSKSKTDIYKCLNNQQEFDPAPILDREPRNTKIDSKMDICISALKAEMDANSVQRKDLSDAIEALKK